MHNLKWFGRQHSRTSKLLYKVGVIWISGWFSNQRLFCGLCSVVVILGVSFLLRGIVQHSSTSTHTPWRAAERGLVSTPATPQRHANTVTVREGPDTPESTIKKTIKWCTPGTAQARVVSGTHFALCKKMSLVYGRLNQALRETWPSLRGKHDGWVMVGWRAIFLWVMLNERNRSMKSEQNETGTGVEPTFSSGVSCHNTSLDNQSHTSKRIL